MIGIRFSKSGKLQQLFRIPDVGGRRLRDGKNSFCQSTRLVKNDRFCASQGFQVISSLYENSCPARTANSAEEGEGNADYKSTGTTDDEKSQRPANPFRPIAKKKWGNDCQQSGSGTDGRCVVACKACDEMFCLGFFQAGVFNQIEDFTHG